MSKNTNTVYGYHTLIQWLTQRPKQVKSIKITCNATGTRAKKVIHYAKLHGISIEISDPNSLDHTMRDKNHQGLLAIVISSVADNQVDTAPLPSSTTDALSFIKAAQKQKPSVFLLILDGVQDPHNLGACLRTACVMGVDAVIAPKNRAVGLTPVVHKVASGAALHIPFFQVTNLAQTMERLKQQGIWLYGATEQGEKSLYDIPLSGSIAWVMGGEGQGLRRLTQEHCDVLVHIPSATHFSTLNVSVATGVCLAETVRQRNNQR